MPWEKQGRSFWNVPTGRSEDVHRDLVFAEMIHHHLYVSTLAVRTGRWKYIRTLPDSPIGLDQLDAMVLAHRLNEPPNLLRCDRDGHLRRGGCGVKNRAEDLRAEEADAYSRPNNAPVAECRNAKR